MAKRGIFRGYGQKDAKAFRSRGASILRKTTFVGSALGLMVSVSIHFTGGNQINVNGKLIQGFLSYAPILVLACAGAGFVLGLIAWLLLRALGEAAGGGKG